MMILSTSSIAKYCTIRLHRLNSRGSHFGCTLPLFVDYSVERARHRCRSYVSVSSIHQYRWMSALNQRQQIFRDSCIKNYSVPISTNVIKAPDQDSAQTSNRAAFQSLPVIPSILAHIEKIGVGIRSKPSLLRKRSSKPNSKRRNDSLSDDTLSLNEEVEFFANKEREHNVRWRDHRSRNTTHHLLEKKKHSFQTRRNPTPDITGSYWLPPPPFSSFAKSDSNPNKPTDPAHALEGRKIIRRPVKCLGKAGSLKDKLPLESKGLSEIAICGRSNVGKSTVLNALLYGNTDESLSPRKFQRGRTPQGAKLPKGMKAITSHKPGETKELSFYQVTADVMMKSSNDSSSDDRSDGNKGNNELVSKMSLLLVDLPGYGFAYAKEERTKEWMELMHHYLLERKSLKRILLLLDARHGFKQTDFEFLRSLQDGLLEKSLTGKVRLSFNCGWSLLIIEIRITNKYFPHRLQKESSLLYKSF